MVQRNLTGYRGSGNVKDVDTSAFVEEFGNDIYLGSIFKGAWPERVKDRFEQLNLGDILSDEALKDIYKPIDFLGINYYTVHFTKFDENGESPFFMKHQKKGCDVTKMDWEIYPEGLYDVLKDVKDKYGNVRIIITENGAAFDDEISPEGEINDEKRKKYIVEHIQELKKAIDYGVNVEGYYVWSLMDNFEWAEGFRMPFGLVHVDYNSQKRTIKNSGKWYAEVIRNNGF